MTEKHVFEAELNINSDLDQFFKSNMVVIRTGFFRALDLYAGLKDIILPQMHQSILQNIHPLRIWSAGCSDGREPYSIALLTKNWFAENKINRVLKIIASDVNDEMIQIAKTGMYQTNEKEYNYLQPHLDDVTFFERSVTINRDIKNLVSFKIEDFINKQPDSKQDIIFCTNVLLYYEKEYRKEIVKLLVNNIKPGGFLFIESVGSLFMKSIGLERVNSTVHYYQKRS